MEISASLVKRLREETDAPLMECKRALQEAAGEGVVGDDALMARAKEILRATGKVQAGKRAERAVSNGVVAVARSGNAAAAVTLLCETDFVARNAEFQALAQKFADYFAEHDPGDDPLSATIDGKTVQEHIEEAVSKIRENIQLGTVRRIQGAGSIGVYLHHDKAKAALVALSHDGVEDLANRIGTQIVALSPEYISRDQVDQARLNKEIAIEKQRATEEGKPEEIAEKIAQGKVSKDFLQQVVLLEQPWYAELKKKVGDVIREAGGGTVVRFVRLEAGKEPIEVSA